MTDFTKQVGWSPSVPATSASITIATDNGDGTGYITNPDGSVVSFCSECTVDTFATVSGSTVTDASGNSVEVPAGSTYDPVANTITTSDGAVVSLMVDTDTDTFATQNSDGDLVLADGTVVPLVAAAPMTSYSQSAPNTIAEVNAGAGTAVDFGSTEWLTTNAAVEIGAEGRRNTSGGQGHYIKRLGSYHTDGSVDGAVIDVVDNGTYAQIAQDAVTDAPLVLNDGKYIGQSLYLKAISANVVKLTGNLYGDNVRYADDRYYGVATGLTDIAIRRREVVHLVWRGSQWVVYNWDKYLYEGLGWRENWNGEVTIFWYANLLELGINENVVLPVTLDGAIESTNTSVAVTDNATVPQAAGVAYTHPSFNSQAIWMPDTLNPNGSINFNTTDLNGSGTYLSRVTFILQTRLHLA